MAKANRYDRDFLRRGRPGDAAQASGKSILAVVEGKQTELIYLEALREELQLSAARVVILHRSVTDPLNIVREAIRLQDEQVERTKKAITVPYDEVWVVFDSERQDHPRRKQIPAAIDLARQKGISIALSTPSFEYWLLLHYAFTTAAFSDCDDVIAALKKYITKYTKNDLPMADLLKRVGDAVCNAGRCHTHWRDCGGDGNPRTYVDLLVASMNGSTGPSFRLF